MSNNQPAQHKAGIIARTLRMMLGALLCWMAYTVMSEQNTGFNLNVLWVFGGVLIFYLLTHVAIIRFRPDLHRWFGALLVVLPILTLFLFGGQAGRVAVVGYVGISMLLLAAKGSGVNGLLYVPALLSGKETQIGCLLFAPIDLIEKNLGGPGGMPG
jgi:hypothetical protein